MKYSNLDQAMGYLKYILMYGEDFKIREEIKDFWLSIYGTDLELEI